MTNVTQRNDNHFFKFACLASIAAGTIFAVGALASAAPIGVALFSGLSLAAGGIILGSLSQFCYRSFGSGRGTGPIVFNDSPGYWGRFVNWYSSPTPWFSSPWLSRPWFSDQSWFSGWGNWRNSGHHRYHDPRVHVHQDAAPFFSPNVHGHQQPMARGFYANANGNQMQRSVYSSAPLPGRPGFFHSPPDNNNPGCSAYQQPYAGGSGYHHTR